MKKVLFSLMVAGSLIFTASAAEKVRWPVWFAFNDIQDIDMVGLRLNLFEGECEQVTGMDLGFIGRSQYYNGIQINFLVNSVEDRLAGWQIGLGYNEAGTCDPFSMQVGLWNQTQSLCGIQCGLVNLADYSTGFQVGLINRSEGINGYQVGLINVIRGSRVPFMPIINFGF
ncbi:MAG: hypothetical protein PF904_11000 [Kiritimatiellae bacterium]|jgi:hypothetical protein|nr:hypothetical protein [Kiritimatiellia bacterium]